MDNYVNVKDVLHTLDLVMSDDKIKHKGKAVRKRLKELPGADVVEVVRCKNCEYGEADYGVNGDIINPFQYRCNYEDTWSRPEHYCGYGKKKEGAEE